MVCPRVTTEKMTEQTVPIGLNMETNTGPLFSSAQPLTLKHIPLTAPACTLEFMPLKHPFIHVIENIKKYYIKSKFNPFKMLPHYKNQMLNYL